VSAIDLAHSPGAEKGGDLVRLQATADGQAHAKSILARVWGRDTALVTAHTICSQMRIE
jgi:hypothetical protein